MIGNRVTRQSHRKKVTIIICEKVTSLKHNFTEFQLVQVSCALRFYFNFQGSRTYITCSKLNYVSNKSQDKKVIYPFKTQFYLLVIPACASFLYFESLLQFPRLKNIISILPSTGLHDWKIKYLVSCIL